MVSRITLLILLIVSFSSCKSSKRTTSNGTGSTKIITKKSTDEPTVFNTENKNSVEPTTPEITYSNADHIIDYAKQFEGVRYKWGGTTEAGMDCSGLVYESFKTYDIILPRASKDMAKRGEKVALKDVLHGDLLFFKTGNRRNSINHVGLIVAIRNNDIEFIHSTSSKGVIISRLNESYWLNAFHEARRVL
ncbi:C40 family peptidase [Tamlana crocina]